MPTFEEAKAHLRWNYTLVEDAEDAVELVWSFDSDDDDDDEPILQPQRLGLVEAMGEPHLLISSPIAPADVIEPLAALEHNASLAIGALAVANDTLYMRAVLGLEHLSWPLLDSAMQYVAYEAAQLRTALDEDDDVGEQE